MTREELLARIPATELALIRAKRVFHQACEDWCRDRRSLQDLITVKAEYRKAIEAHRAYLDGKQ